MMRESEFEALMQVPSDLQGVHEELENWGRWSRGRPNQGHCASAEHRYSAAPDSGGNAMAAEIVGRRAAALHPHICAIPEKQRWLLHLWYVHRVPVGFIRRRLGLHGSAVPVELNKARRMVANRLRIGVASAPTT